MDNLRKVNFVLLVLWVTFTLILTIPSLIYGLFRGSSLVILFALPGIIVFTLIYLIIIRSNIAYNINRPYFLRSILFYSLIMILVFTELINSIWGILVLIIALYIILVSLYKAYIDFKNLNSSNPISILNYILITFHNGRILKNKLKSTKDYDLDKQTKSNTNIKSSYNNISSQPSPTSYSQASTQNSPQISFTEKENLTPTNIPQPSPNTPLQEIQSEYNSNQNSTDNLNQKIQNHYTDNTVNATQEYVVKSNLSKIRNTIFSGFLILGFLAFSFLSLGGIIVGDLTVSGVLTVASIILAIDGYLFYLMWFKK